MKCLLCGGVQREPWGHVAKMFQNDTCFCLSCAIAACEKQLEAGKRCRFYPDQPTDCTIETCEFAKEYGVKCNEDCGYWRAE